MNISAVYAPENSSMDFGLVDPEGVFVIIAVFCMTGFKGKPKEVYLEDMQGETLPDGGTRSDLGDGDFVIEPGN